MKGRIYTSAQVSICQSRESASNQKEQSINSQCWMALVGFSHACLPGHRWLFRPKPIYTILICQLEGQIVTRPQRKRVKKRYFTNEENEALI